MEVKLEICCGTTCFMLGASKLLKFGENLPEEWQNRIEISGLPCMEACTAEEIGHAPFVRINGRVFGDMTVEKLRARLAGLLDGKESADHV